MRISPKTSAVLLTSYARLTIFDDINATVENGMVTLTGKVTMPYKKNDLEKRIAKIDGVRGLRNDIGVLPVSQFDDELRYRVSRAPSTAIRRSGTTRPWRIRRSTSSWKADT